ncbi:phosphate signaling complex protein PhoU [Sedimentisphaera salicampi]|uniref:Phosphate-specific transport system accessory protein PhoU n=1 Tax=Sedimentisphaera salicampi TaxID=1941349 RepID=A0A1W6LLA9_9BACT|nr:phosphate signaling complex protein PhoU [Sedimentisphaera salicampi]ARN56559.1 PhoU-like phosphate uptake regulator [Sedimentisphaera salicampi]OXU15444.1 PhoU-like phosphate uptake regulator [Sedimentisphaera salicampi]
MSLHLKREIEKLKTKVLKLGSLVEEAVQQATIAMKNRDLKLAKMVIRKDIMIDEMEVDVEEECLKVLALHQPVAIDLRFIVSVLKINNDLERIGDLAVKIAERVPCIAENFQVSVEPDYVDMAQKVQLMLQKSLDALVEMDQGLAEQVRGMDDEIDRLNIEISEQIRKGITEIDNDFENYMQLLNIPKSLERIADHAANISEDVIYMIEGKIVRHTTGQEDE